MTEWLTLFAAILFVFIDIAELYDKLSKVLAISIQLSSFNIRKSA